MKRLVVAWALINAVLLGNFVTFLLLAFILFSCENIFRHPDWQKNVGLGLRDQALCQAGCQVFETFKLRILKILGFSYTVKFRNFEYLGGQ